MSDDIEISEWMKRIVNQSDNIDLFSKNNYNIENDNDIEKDFVIFDDDQESLEEARKLLKNWSNQSETFQREKNSEKLRPKVVEYKKLDMPMMVAKRAKKIVVRDPTQKMEERRKHLQEMREQRIARQNTEKVAPSRSPRNYKVNVQVPDIDSEILMYRRRLNEKVNEKQKEIENREIRLKRIEDEAFMDVEKEMNLDNQNNKANENKKRITNLNKINTRKSVQDDKHKDDNKESDQSMKLKLTIFLKNEIIRRKRFYFSKWSRKCHFQSAAFKKAAVLANFKLTSKLFSFWRQRLNQVVNNREIRQLEEKLRKRKKQEKFIEQSFRKKHLMKFLTIWRIKYKARVEFQIAEARKQKRLELVVTRIAPNSKPQQVRQNNSNWNAKNANSKKIRNNIEPIRKIVPKQKDQVNGNLYIGSPPNNQSCNDNSYSQSPNSKDSSSSTQRKVKKIKINPKIEAMEKRNEELKRKRMEMLQKQSEKENEEKLKKDKEREEKVRQERKEHLKKLELERKKREEERKKQNERENAKERLAYITQQAAQFRTKMVRLNALKNWHKIIRIKQDMEDLSISFNTKKLKQKVLKSFLFNINENEYERNLIASKFYSMLLMKHIYYSWKEVRSKTHNNEVKLKNVINHIYLKKAFLTIIRVQKQNKKKRFLKIQNKLRIEMMRRVFKAWPKGCALIKEDEEREAERENLLLKALQYLDEISSDDL